MPTRPTNVLCLLTVAASLTQLPACDGPGSGAHYTAVPLNAASDQGALAEVTPDAVAADNAPDSEAGADTEAPFDADSGADAFPELAPDVVPDVVLEVAPDAGPDASVAAETTADVEPDADPDPVADSGPDSVPDAAPDSVADTEPETAPDAAAEPDTVPDAEPDTVPDVEPDTAPDVAPCVPDCGGKTCGSDGCGGSCGSCGSVSNGLEVCLGEAADSCGGRCGDVLTSCACDTLCVQYGDCCSDYDAACVDGGLAGTCAMLCDPGYHPCDGSCVLYDSANACGPDCLTCPSPVGGNGVASCNGGTCGVACDPGYHLCGDDCLPDDDATACGAACEVCPGAANGGGVAACIDGACEVDCDFGMMPCAEGCCVAEVTVETIHDSSYVTRGLKVMVDGNDKIHVASFEVDDGIWYLQKPSGGSWAPEKIAGPTTYGEFIDLALSEDSFLPTIGYYTDDLGGSGRISRRSEDGSWMHWDYDTYTIPFRLSPWYKLQEPLFLGAATLKLVNGTIIYGNAIALDDGLGTNKVPVNADIANGMVVYVSEGYIVVRDTGGFYTNYTWWGESGLGTRMELAVRGDVTYVVYERYDQIRARSFTGPDIDAWSSPVTVLDGLPYDHHWDAAVTPDGEVVLCYRDTQTASKLHVTRAGGVPFTPVDHGGSYCDIDVDAAGDFHIVHLGPAPEGQATWTGSVEYVHVPGTLVD